MSNLLKAIIQIVDNPDINLQEVAFGTNRINSVGDAMQEYIKDAFAECLNESNYLSKIEKHSQIFSYLGNQNNPPDLILKNGDAIEVKKIESSSSNLALNSSYPKAKLSIYDKKINNACRNCENENWIEKDIIYVIGQAIKAHLKSLWIVYGDCYAASSHVYEKVQNKIIAGVAEIPDIEFAKTNELAGIKKVDPLGITNLRVRGMWGIAHPRKVFDYLPKSQNDAQLELKVILLKAKYNSFPYDDKQAIETHIKIKKFDIKIKNPNNPAQLLDAVLISLL
jgi:hypothetical protein